MPIQAPLASLQATWLALDDFNKSISSLGQSLADRISDRQDAMATLKTTFDGVKTSVKGQYGQRSPQYAGISAISW